MATQTSRRRPRDSFQQLAHRLELRTDDAKGDGAGLHYGVLTGLISTNGKAEVVAQFLHFVAGRNGDMEHVSNIAQVLLSNTCVLFLLIYVFLLVFGLSLRVLTVYVYLLLSLLLELRFFVRLLNVFVLS